METEFLHYFEIKKTKGSIYKFCWRIIRNLISLSYWKYYYPVIFSPSFAKTAQEYLGVKWWRFALEASEPRCPHQRLGQTSAPCSGSRWQRCSAVPLQRGIDIPLAHASGSTGKHTYIQCVLRQGLKWIMDFRTTVLYWLLFNTKFCFSDQ